MGLQIRTKTVLAGAASRLRRPKPDRLLGACRTWGVDSEKRPQRGQFLPDLQAHSSTMGQKAGKKWTAEAVSQPTIPKPDRLLVALLTALTRDTLPDANLAAMRSEVEAIRMVDETDILERWRSRGHVVTRDMLALNQGTRGPGHMRVLAKVAVASCPYMAAKEMSRLARRIAIHAEALGLGAAPLSNRAIPLHVFIGHGRSALWRELKDHIKDDLGLQPDEFNRVPVAGVATSDPPVICLTVSAFLPSRGHPHSVLPSKAVRRQDEARLR